MNFEIHQSINEGDNQWAVNGLLKLEIQYRLIHFK